MRAQRRFTDSRLLVPVVLLIVTTVYLIDAVKMGPPMQSAHVTTSFFPIAIAALMYIALGAVVWRIIRLPRHRDASSPEPELHERRFGPLWITLCTGLYIGVFTTVGYFISTAFYVFALTLIFGEKSQGLVFKLIATLLITGLGFVLFDMIFQVRLPVLWGE